MIESKLLVEQWRDKEGREITTAVKAFRRVTADAFKEAELHSFASIASAGVVKFYEKSFDPSSLRLRMEYCPHGSLRCQLQSHSSQFYPADYILSQTQFLLRTLTEMHTARIAHRQIDATNLLVAEDGCIKLTDFGEAKLVEVSSTVARHTLEGHEGHLGPEARSKARVQRQMEMDIFKEDVYCLGKVIYELATLRLFPTHQIDIAAAKQRLRGEFEARGYAGLIETVMAMLAWSNERRCSAEEVIGLLERCNPGVLSSSG